MKTFMKTFKRTNLPENIRYNGEVYKLDLSNDRQFKKTVIVEVLSPQLKNRTDLWGKPYKPTRFYFTVQ